MRIKKERLDPVHLTGIKQEISPIKDFFYDNDRTVCGVAPGSSLDKKRAYFCSSFFSMGFFDPASITGAVFGFVCFSLLASIVYIFNDIQDIEKDRSHNTKCRRPLASGKIPVCHAVITFAVLAMLLIVLLFLFGRGRMYTSFFIFIGLMALYLLLNIGYSRGLKNIPIVDVTILAAGYVIRVLAGAAIIEVDVSAWLCLMITVTAYYLGFGKRRNEINGTEKETRAVLRFYSHNFLDKNMYVCQTLSVIFYALWSIDSVTIQKFNTSRFVYTIPLILIIFFKYSLNIETGTEGDPTSVLFRDKILLILCGGYVVSAFFIIYINRITG